VEAAAEERFRAWAAARVARLHRAAYLLCGDWHVAEDLVQETLARTALHWSAVERSEYPEAYVRQILLNQIRQRWRRRLGRERPVASPDQGMVADGTNERAARDELMAALRQLPPKQRAAVVLRYFEQLSEAETAMALNCSVGTVKSQTHRALSTLRTLMTDEVIPC
jgi:RNA polymerase sigma-70 factor (sigma-E family)